MTEPEASRTLVKSPRELWAECSDAESLARHLDRFGEIRITRLEPETAVAWEGECASGTVRLEPSGWGTRVILTARAAPAAPAAREPAPAAPRAPAAQEPASEAPQAREPDTPETPEALEPETPEAPGPPEPPAPEPPPPAAQAVAPTPRRGLLSRIFGRRATIEPVPIAPGPPPAPESSAEPAPAAAEPAPPAPEPTVESALPVPERAADPLQAEELLQAALDSLGQAHHRPFSRS